MYDFATPPPQGQCVQQVYVLHTWQSADCNAISFAVCNVYSHAPNFTVSQLGSFWLIVQQLLSYVDREQMCRDYISTRSQGAVLYHPLENE